MSTSSWILAGALVVSAVAGCEKAPAPPPDAPSSAPTDAPSAATTPVAETASAEAPAPEAPSAAPVAEPSPSAAASSAPEAPATTKHAASHAAKEHAAEPPSTPAPADAQPVEDACQTKNFHYSQIASACKSGGRKAAKMVMKGAVGKAKAAGTDLKCTSCHEDMKDFHLKSNAVGDLKNWL